MGERNIAAATLVATLLACWAVPARAAQADELAAAEARAARAEQEAILARREVEALRERAAALAAQERAQAAEREVAQLRLALAQPQPPPAPPAEPAVDEPAPPPPAPPPVPPRGSQEFGGIEFGVGISFTLDIGSSDRIAEAELVNGIVRVKDENNGVARIMLESHYFFTPGGTGLFGTPAGQWGHGPFIAVQPGTDDIIQAIGAGWMWGFRRPVAQGGDTGQSFNIGVGIVVDPNTRVLGDGIVENQPLPAGETSIRYREEMQTGVVVLASFSF